MSKQDSIKVSVIVPTFNAGAYIGQALESVLLQTEQNFEIIVCDDGSTDDTATVVQTLAQNDCRIQLIKNQQNSGPSYSRNQAISIAKGEWIALLDADDFYHPERLNKLITIAESSHADMVADNICYVDINGKHLAVAMAETKPNNDFKIVSATEFIANDSPIKTGFNYGYLKPIMRSSFLSENKIAYDEKVRLGEDFLLCVECLLKGAVLVVTNQPYYYYRMVAQSLSRTGDNAKYQELMDNNLKLTHIAITTKNTAAVKLLEKRQHNYDVLMIYNEIINFLKKSRFYSAARKLLTNPTAWLGCLRLAGLHIKRILSK